MQGRSELRRRTRALVAGSRWTSAMGFHDRTADRPADAHAAKIHGLVTHHFSGPPASGIRALRKKISNSFQLEPAHDGPRRTCYGAICSLRVKSVMRSQLVL